MPSYSLNQPTGNWRKMLFGDKMAQFGNKSYFTFWMPLSPHLVATWVHYHQLHGRVSILGQRTLSEGTTLRRGSSSAAHHIGTRLKRSDTTSADWLHTTLCSYGSGSAMTICSGVIQIPVAGQSGRIPVPCWPQLPNPKLLATSFLYQMCSSPTTVVFWNKAGLVDGQTRRCGLASLVGALSSLRTSVAALRRGLAGAILARTGSHYNCVGRSVPVMRRMMLLSCTPTRSVCDDLDHTGQQYSPTDCQFGEEIVSAPRLCSSLGQVMFVG